MSGLAAENARLRDVMEKLAAGLESDIEHLRLTGVNRGNRDRQHLADRIREALGQGDAPAAPQAEAGRQARQLDAALRGLAQIREHVEDEHREWPDVELVVNDVIGEINEIADGRWMAAADPEPAPELKAAMAETRAIRGRVEALRSELLTSARITEPSKKTDVERAVAAKLASILEGK